MASNAASAANTPTRVVFNRRADWSRATIWTTLAISAIGCSASSAWTAWRSTGASANGLGPRTATQSETRPRHAPRSRAQLEQRQQQRHDGGLYRDHQRGHAGRHPQLRPVQKAVAHEEEEEPEDEPRADSLPRRPLSFQQRPRQQDGARDEGVDHALYRLGGVLESAPKSPPR